MNIYPTRKKFLEWSKRYNRVPITGELHFPSFDPINLFNHLFNNDDEAFLFESGNSSSDSSRYTFIGASNKLYIKITDKHSMIKLYKSCKPFIGSVNEGWDKLNFDNNIPCYQHLPHFWGGWIGYISYEAGCLFEKLPKRKNNDLGLPYAYFIQVDRVIVYDHSLKLLKYIIASTPNKDGTMYDKYIEEINKFQNKFNSIFLNISIKNLKPVLKLSSNKSTSNYQSNLTSNEYKERVNRVKMYINEGDTYQVNIAQRFQTNFKGDPFKLFQSLRAINPAPFSGFLRFSNFSIVSSSPERLIKIYENKLETRPIAGTRPRGVDSTKDALLTKELLLSEKERAEHLMLVDLERSDIGRVCINGSVNVTDFMIIEQYSHVSHIVSNIEGKLKENTTTFDILKAVFPGGTITGCPKIRCMEIINELEPSDRGPYSGSFGYIGFGQQLDLNIIIRTIIVKGEKAFFHVGAGIVADSDPDKEFEETLAKAAAMIKAIDA